MKKKRGTPEEIKIKLIPDKLSWYRNGMQRAIVATILLTIVLCFSPLLEDGKQFTNWDDPSYVIKQEMITGIDADHIATMFNPEHAVLLNYHPLTMLSLAINYHFSQLNPSGYFLTNLLLHVSNAFLVFIFLYLLSGKRFWVGAVAALLFGIHPMHVESVAWISERKDILYSFFFLASCAFYLVYLERKEIKYIIICFVLFLFSCLSKAMAVPLPIVLLLIDMYTQRRFTMRTVAEKIPFFLLALVVGIMAYRIQLYQPKTEVIVFGLPLRFMFASYNFLAYWVKFFLPTGLSAFYPYPVVSGEGGIPVLYRLAPVLALCLVMTTILIVYRKRKERFRIVLFGIGFFTVMVALVLQLIPVGTAIMADRYSYLPYIGGFFILASLTSAYFEDPRTKTLAMGALIVISAILAVQCYTRVKVWRDSETLWTDVIQKYPYVIEQTGDETKVAQVGVALAYKNRGLFYHARGEPGDMEKGFADYMVLVRAHVPDAAVYTVAGNFYGLKRQFDEAIQMYGVALQMKPDNAEAYMNRGLTYSAMGEHQKALDDFLTALRINPASTKLQAHVAREKSILKIK